MNQGALEADTVPNSNDAPSWRICRLFEDETGWSKGVPAAPDFRALVDALPTAIYATDAQGRLTYFNPAAVEFSGRVPHLGSDHWCVSWKLYQTDGSKLPHAKSPMARAITEGRAIFGEEAIAERPDGWRIHFAAFPTPILDSAGRLMGGVNMLLDITDRKRAAKALAESEGRFARFMQFLPGLAWIKDVAGRYVFANDAAKRVFRVPGDGLYGKTDEELFSPQVADAFRGNDRQALASGTGLQTIEYLLHEDGVVHESLVSKFPISGADGQAHYVGGIALDITDLKRGQEAEAHLAAIVASSSDAIVSKDLSGFIRSWNHAAESLFGYTAREAIGRNITMLMPPERIAEETAIQSRIRRGERVDHYETVRRRKDGSLVDVSLTISPLADGQGRIIGASKIARDITDRKQADAALARSQALLEAELADSRLLQSVSAELIREDNVAALYEKIIDAAVAIMRSDFASMQLLHLERGELRLLTHRGFSPEAAHQWEWVRASSACACGVALATGERVIVPDVESCVFMAGTEQLATYRQTGIRAVQTTPLLSRSGKLLGMISTHWGRPHEPSERDLRLFDILARQAADLIERKRADEELRESEGRFRMLANSAPVLMWLNDASGCVFVNRAYLQFLGVSDEGAVQGNEWSGYVHPDDRQGYLGAWLDALSKRAPFSAEFRFRRHDGVYRWMQSVGMPRYTAFGEFLGFHGCTYDVHEARVAAELLREADRHKDEFLAMLAHELRNPLAPIQSALGAILLKGADPAEVRSEAAMMQRHVAQLRRLVDDLLDMSRISRGRIELHKKSVDLGAIAREAAEAVRPLANRTELNLCVSVPGERLWVDGDATRLTQVMANLLQNACKFTPSGGQIELVVERAHEQALVRVRDSGIGIAAENLRNIFEMFSQVDTSLERSREGLGLGLTLVRVLIELHGGTVVARSDGVGRGSEFIVTLPLVTAPATELPAKTTGDMESPAPSRRILIVDDNRDAASSLAKLLYICGHSTLTAFDGEEALAAAEEFRPDVFLLDIGLPKLNGYDLCTRIRQMPWAAGAIIVALTGWGQESDRQRSKQAGFDLHLVKPVDLDVLERLLGQPEDGTTETPHVASQAT